MQSFKKIPKELNKEKRKIPKKGGINIQASARSNHRYNNPPHMVTKTRRYSPSGNLDRSISYSVKKIRNKNNIAMRVYLDPEITATASGFSYGIPQHDGMGAGYNPSPISPRFGTTGRNNLESDWFLYRAFKKELPTIKKELHRAPLVAIRKAGI